METHDFKALVVSEVDGRYVRDITTRSTADLPKGDVLINVKYSSLNYKDALSAAGNRGVTRNYPHTPGVDAAGLVTASDSERFSPGEEVIVTGYDLGMNTSGGFAQFIRVPASWVVKLPRTLSLREAMAYGTAGFTAATSVYRLEEGGVEPDMGDILVTGATGGVGSLAVGILSKIGYRVVAATGKAELREYLVSLGAQKVIPREQVDDDTGKALAKSRWAGVVDTVGGNILATAIKGTKFGGTVTTCGNVRSDVLNTSVYPFILRAIRLQGIASAGCSEPLRLKIWEKIAGEWKLDNLDCIVRECSLDELSSMIDVILAGRMRGRVLVNLDM